jgi:micrococcal nuclease
MTRHALTHHALTHRTLAAAVLAAVVLAGCGAPTPTASEPPGASTPTTSQLDADPGTGLVDPDAAPTGQEPEQAAGGDRGDTAAPSADAEGDRPETTPVTPPGTVDAAPDTHTPQDALSTDPDTPTEVWQVDRVVDGDTIDVIDTAGTRERVRFIGTDTPERGECGFDTATDRLRQLLAGRTITLTPGARDDRDRWGRLLRYVEADGTDTGYTLIVEGLAIARYDSRDGYGTHPREAAYVSADLAADHPYCPAG